MIPDFVHDIQDRDPQRAKLGQAVEQYLATGGSIATLPYLAPRELTRAAEFNSSTPRVRGIAAESDPRRGQPISTLPPSPTCCRRWRLPMSKRKPNNTRARVERARRALLSSNYVGVINIDPHGGQFLVHLKTGKPIRHGVALANAVCDIAHRCVIYFSAFCIDQNGLHYIKSSEIATPGIHLAGQLTEVIEEHYRALMDTCNRRHIVGSAWIANPCRVSLSEQQAAHIYDVIGAWAHIEHTKAA